MRRFGDGAAKPVLLAGLVMLAGCAVAPAGPGYGYGEAPGYYGYGAGYYGYGYAPGYYEPGFAGPFCCFRDEDRHDQDRHDMPQGGAVAHNPAAPRAASGSSQPSPVGAPVIHAPQRAAAARGPGGAPAGHASEGPGQGHPGSNSSSAGGPWHRE